MVDGVELGPFGGGRLQPGDFEPAIGDVLVHAQGIHRQLRDALAEGERGLIQLLGRDGVVDYVDAFGLDAIDHVAGEEQLFRLEHADLRGPEAEGGRDA